MVSLFVFEHVGRDCAADETDLSEGAADKLRVAGGGGGRGGGFRGGEAVVESLSELDLWEASVGERMVEIGRTIDFALAIRASRSLRASSSESSRSFASMSIPRRIPSANHVSAPPRTLPKSGNSPIPAPLSSSLLPRPLPSLSKSHSFASSALLS